MLNNFVRGGNSAYLNVINKIGSRLLSQNSSVAKSHKGRTYFYTTVLTGIGIASIYDGFNEFEYCGGAGRFFRSLKIATEISADYAWNLYSLQENTKEYNEMVKTVNQRCAERLLAGCLVNGGLYIKIGQGISAINHILPKEYTETLSRLENECLPRKAEEVNQLFLQDFGKTPEQLFAKFNYTPIAAASLAQVFRATTKSGQEVAVKVQYIDLQKRFSGDFGTIQFIQSLVKMIHKSYNFSWILNDVRGNLEQELNFINEGHNAEKCAKDLAKFSFIHVPKVHWELTSSRVLTAEWIDGYKITDVEQIKRDKFKLKDIDQKLFNTFSEQIFSTGFVHADPHPGNVFIRKNKKGKAEIILLDHGLYETLPAQVRHSLCQFWEAIVLKDVNKMKKYATELNVDDYDKLAEVLLQRPLDMSGSLSTRLTEKDIEYMQQMAKERFDTVLTTLKQMPKTMLFVIRNLNTIRAIARNHGDPLDRPAYMARYAQKCIYKYEKGFFSSFKWLKRRITFEIQLLRVSLNFWCIKTYLKFLTCINRSPDTRKLFEVDY